MINLWQVVVYCHSDILFFFKQKTAYEFRTGDWSSDGALPIYLKEDIHGDLNKGVVSSSGSHYKETLKSIENLTEIGRASCRERV